MLRNNQLSIIFSDNLTEYKIMINLQSPHFSHSSKIELMNKMSPSVRNRVPSTQDLYTSSQWNKVQSCKKLDSPSKLS